MWGQANAAMQERVDHLSDYNDHDPFAELRPTEPLRRRKPKLRLHQGSVHQVLPEPGVVEEPVEVPTRNAKYWAAPRVNLEVARRMVAMVITLSFFAAATGGATVVSSESFQWLRLLAG